MIVITSVNLGWDCVVAVYPAYANLEYVKLAYPEKDGYVIHDVTPSTTDDLVDVIEERGLDLADLIAQDILESRK